MPDQHSISENLKKLVQIFDNQNKTGIIPLQNTEVVPVYDKLAYNFENIGNKLENSIHLMNNNHKDIIDEIQEIIISMRSSSNLFNNLVDQIQENPNAYIPPDKIIINNQEESNIHISNTRINKGHRITMCGMNYELISRKDGKVVSIYELNKNHFKNNELCNICYTVHVTSLDNISVNPYA